MLHLYWIWLAPMGLCAEPANRVTACPLVRTSAFVSWKEHQATAWGLRMRTDPLHQLYVFAMGRWKPVLIA